MKTIDAKSVIVGIVVTAAIAGGLYFFATADSSDDDDRPVIIVRGGSVEMEQQNQEWELDPKDMKKGRPNQPHGGNVIGFMVTFESVDAAGASGCPTLPVVGSSVDIEYQPGILDAKREHVVFNSVQNGSKNEPVITAPNDMKLSANKKTLIHRDGDHGSIVSVTVNYGATQTCTPTSGKFAGKIRVKPLR